MASGVTVTNSMADNDYDAAMDKAIEAALVQAGIILERQAALLAPVDTGRLRGSITYATKRHQSNARSGGLSGDSRTARSVGIPAGQGDTVREPNKKWTLHVGSNVEYAQYIEYGTRDSVKIFGVKSIFKTKRRRMQPFLRPALMAYRKDIIRDFNKWVQKFLRKGK